MYKEGDNYISFYLVVFGKIILHNKDLGALGIVKMGEFVGEEILEKTKLS